MRQSKRKPRKKRSRHRCGWCLKWIAHGCPMTSRGEVPQHIRCAAEFDAWARERERKGLRWRPRENRP